MMVEGVDALVRQLNYKARQVGDPDVSAAVGYSSPYAVAVHENRQMRWRGKPRRSGIGKYWDARNGPGRAGFLLDVGREIQGRMRSTVNSYVRQGRTLAQAVMAAARLLQRESMKEVPYEHGHLRASAYARLERGRE